MSDDAVYVYAIGDAALAADLPAVAGVGGTLVRAVGSGALAAVASSVDAGEFGEDALRHNLEDLGWLADTARAHHAVVDTVARHHPIAPVRLATVYLDDANVRALLDERAAAFTAALERVRGRTEWGVKAFAAPQAAEEPQAAEPQPPAPSEAGPGTAYLMRRRAARNRAAESRRSAADAASRLHEELAGLAVANRRYPPQDPQLTGSRDEMVLNAAYLVENAGEAAVRRLVEERGAPGLRLQLTGPWAPYSFATLEET
ncbi:GvpL/GvpF family gas vesicle protein [Pseudonocardia asaccharolytica]|uniref:Gas vesicle protein n=1 Tax=Pseudonocardia asaccharolytica DSM 44247 = NBRC 16224 TaxID=1123024 RepID=A0A511D3U6_9PSEU|nr:GvpL/GvpF family gas vesicle protein [Pseudonocardia asaccharolytica]GEL17588.1 gas vesicle protein [Pseudonocardia asaccharolytica DSM 44247 = NBRC 16224]